MASLLKCDHTLVNSVLKILCKCIEKVTEYSRKDSASLLESLLTFLLSLFSLLAPSPDEIRN